MTQSERSKPIIGILGVGNILLRDEGFGVHFVNLLQQQYQFPDNVLLHDGGTAGIMLSSFVEQCDILLVVDVIDCNDAPGTIHFHSKEDLQAGIIQTRMSPHQVGLLEIIDIGGLSGRTPEVIELLSVTPESLETGLELTPTLSAKMTEMLKLLASRLSYYKINMEPQKPSRSTPATLPLGCI